MYLVIVIAPFANIPQLSKVWIEKDVKGVSPLSWFLFSVISVIWLGYGILHKDKHILLMNAALIVVQMFIAIGAVIYR
ncbi:MAG: SemiSWEET family transporter [Candidatus Shapirobacteria bacterium]|nr:SemiSWEET family transporter [Candidatus Shapirobacteria bacterium]